MSTREPQFSTRRSIPWVYWLAVAMIGVFGTMAADVLHVQSHVPYAASAIGFGTVHATVSSSGREPKARPGER